MSVSRPLSIAAAPPATRRAWTQADARTFESVLIAGLVLVAFGLRLPYLWTIPRFTDETREVLLAYQILRGEDAGLVNIDAYIGGLYNWVLAILFWIFGPSWAIPRLLTALAGAATVAATFLLARDIGGRLAGVLGAALLATAGGHILSNGHIAWSHCLTPLFTTLGAWLLQRGVRERRPAALLASGLAFGTALQTHPASLVLLPGAALYVLWWGRALLRTWWPYLAAALFMVAYGNVVIYNLTSGGESFLAAGEIREHYARGRPILIDAATYAANQGIHGLMLLRYLAGAIDARVGGATAYLADPTLWIYGTLSGAGLVWSARRGTGLPLLMTASSIVILPYLNERKYVPISDGRYLMPILPLAFAGIGTLAADTWRRLPAAWTPWRVGWTLVVAALILHPLVPMSRYFEQESLAGRTNDELFRALAAIEASRRSDEQVLIQSDLRDIKFDGGGTAFRSMRFLLAGAGVPERSVDELRDHVRRQPLGWSALVVLDENAYRGLDANRAQLHEIGASASPISEPGLPGGLGVFRVQRNAVEPSAPQPAPLATTGPVPIEVFATGFVNPRGLLFQADGSLLVAEAGTGGPQLVEVGREKPHAIGRTGRVVRITPGGDRYELVRGIPSIVTALGEEVGPTALAALDDRIYLLTAAGGWDVGDPEFNSGIFEIRSDGSLRRVADLSTFIKENPTRARQEDPRADVPFGMPYGLAVLNGRFYVSDANQEQVLEVTPTGEVRRIGDYPRSNRALTGIAAGPDGALYVAEFASQKVTRLTLTGQFEDGATKLRTPIGITFDPAGSMYVLEYTGRVLRAAPVGQEQRDVLAEGLRMPTAIAYGPDGNLYVSVNGHQAGRGEGQILRLRLQPAPPVSAARWIAFAGPWIGGLVVLAIALGIGWRFRQGREPSPK